MLFKLPGMKFLDTGEGLSAIGATLLCYAITTMLLGNGFVAVFVSAIVIRSTAPKDQFHVTMAEFAAQIERVLVMFILLILGWRLVRPAARHHADGSSSGARTASRNPAVGGQQWFRRLQKEPLVADADGLLRHPRHRHAVLSAIRFRRSTLRPAVGSQADLGRPWSGHALSLDMSGGAPRLA